MQRFNEQTLNENGKLMIDFCSLNGFRITNTFFNHKEQHNYIPSSEILDVRTLNSADVGSDHSLLLGKFRIKCHHKRKDQSHVTNEETIKIDTFWDTTTRELYKRRLREKIELNPADNRDEVNTIWLKLKTNIKSAAIEALGTKTAESYNAYKNIRNKTGTLVRRMKDMHWEKFSKQLEKDFYGLQKQMWRFIRNQKKEITELIPVSQIDKETWTAYLKDLYKDDQPNTTQGVKDIMINNNISIDEADMRKALYGLKNRKSPGQDGIANELLKYGGERSVQELTILTQRILEQKKIPDEWRTSIMILLFKKGDKKQPGNYRGINLLCTTLKLVTEVISNLIS
ncbi:uncharacterized protein LOC122521574 [Polistes fuscatus]|uniref:uncharacterized protein LOC122521574 n=1 Tax=Polistes fuscatus TaxID=30207 RepID=UPI001CA99D6A|nr:uncharacterized protein LOC122521574 [Polistes fuscatus]